MEGTDWDIGVPPERIRQAIEGSGHTLVDVARRLGISRSAVDQWCNGEKTPNLRNLRLLALVCGRPMAWFFGEETVPEHITRDAEIGRRIRLAFPGIEALLGAPQSDPFGLVSGLALGGRQAA